MKQKMTSTKAVINDKPANTKSSSAFKAVKKRAWYIIISFVIISFVVVYASMSDELSQLSSLEDQMTEVGSELQLLCHREFSLLSRLDGFEDNDFTNSCEQFSFDCLYQCRDIRVSNREVIQTRTFTDTEVEVISMLSNINRNTNETAKIYNAIVSEHVSISRTSPLKFFKIFILTVEAF